MDLKTTFLALGEAEDYIPKEKRALYVYYWAGRQTEGIPHILIPRDILSITDAVQSPAYLQDESKVFLVNVKDSKIYFVIYRYGGVMEKGHPILSEEGAISYEHVIDVFYSDSLVDAKKRLVEQADKYFH